MCGQVPKHVVGPQRVCADIDLTLLPKLLSASLHCLLNIHVFREVATFKAGLVAMSGRWPILAHNEHIVPILVRFVGQIHDVAIARVACHPWNDQHALVSWRFCGHLVVNK